VDFLNHELGARTRRGNKWTPKSLYNILTNVVYIGKVKWRGEVVEGRHEPLIEVPTFERVNQLLAMNRRGGRGRKRMKFYTTGIIQESLSDISILNEFQPYLKKERTENVSDEKVKIWHIKEYHFPKDEIEQINNELVHHIKEGWYIHSFNVEDEVLFVIMKGKYFKLPTKRNEEWNEMIEYGKEIGVERRYIENIPLEV